ncbi:hypothetical protein GOODEAATRI_004803 [Goodea atripinnis]|uniref:Ig-like domain-containing protein n=1 Tax=Goodea atripinnis TaxID=208336 RepID=A0ABV0P1I8_9TELE
MVPLRTLGLLLLSWLTYGSNLTCPPRLDPVILDAPGIIEYGTEVHANCSSTEKRFEELTLWLGNKSCGSEIWDTDVSCDAPASDFQMKAVCIIKFNGTFQCSKELAITVYRNPEVRLSVKDGNVRQTDYELHCDVFHDTSAQNFSVTWYKNNKIFKTVPFIESHGKQENISDILTIDISREENFAEFRCEVQLDLGRQKPPDPVISTTYNVSARYAPEVRTYSNKKITVAKGGDATLLCDVEGNPPPEYQWTVDEEPLSETTDRLDIFQVNSSSTYTCTATNILGNITVQVYVVVEEMTTTGPAAVSNPEEKALENCGLTLMPSEVYVKYGDPASINCSTASRDVVKMSWEFSVGSSSETPPTVTWTVEKLKDFTAKPFCFVTLNDDNQCTIKPDIILYKLPDSVALSAVGNGSMREGEEHQLECVIHAVTPANKLLVKWYKDNENVLSDDKKNLSLSPPGSLKTLSYFYTFTAKKSDNGSLFRCEAEFQFGPAGPLVPPSMASKPYTAHVHYKPTFKACNSHYTGVENRFRLHDLSCETDGNPPPDIKWYYNGALIDSLKLLNRNDSGIYTATVHNSMGQVKTDVSIRVEYRPSLSCQMLYEVKVNEAPKTLCELEGSPPPDISWLKNGTEIFPRHWKKHESGNYSLKASNKHGKAEQHFYLNILYSPEFTESDTTVGFTADNNVSLVCNADGNPEPEIKWTHYQPADNVRETTVGRQKIITITRATSTNAGHYICVATNKVGNVTRSVILVKRDKIDHFFTYWWVILLLVLVIVIVILGLIYGNNRRRQGLYTFVHDQIIPMQSNTTVENGAQLLNGEK